jgi:hypothetical protein
MQIAYQGQPGAFSEAAAPLVACRRFELESPPIPGRPWACRLDAALAAGGDERPSARAFTHLVECVPTRCPLGSHASWTTRREALPDSCGVAS